MPPIETPSNEGYSIGNCALAALAGAVANNLALGLFSKGSWAGSILLLVMSLGIGFLILVSAGRPMARKLVSKSRDTSINGLLLGAAVGSLTGTVLAGITISLLFGWSAAAFLFVAPLYGLIFGVVNGAVAGFSFVWLGRRGSAAQSPGDTE